MRRPDLHSLVQQLDTALAISMDAEDVYLNQNQLFNALAQREETAAIEACLNVLQPFLESDTQVAEEAA